MRTQLPGLKGKRLALVGFCSEDAVRFREEIENAGAFYRALDFAGRGLAEELRAFDAVILKMEAISGSPNWGELPLVAVGTEGEIASRLKWFGKAHRQFALEPWNPPELALRAATALAAGTSPSLGPPAQPTILLADDDPSITALLKATLTRQGIVCHIASNGGRALAFARELRPNVIVLDVNMPDQSGFEVLAELRKDDATRDTRVLLLTACAQESDVVRGFVLGSDDYVVKPFNPMEVAARVKRLLAPCK